MKFGTFTTALAATVLLCGVAPTIAPAQNAPYYPGTVYSLHSTAQGACPDMDWHMVAGTGGALTGMVSWDGMKSIARLQGQVDPSGKFKLEATEVGGAGRTATITGESGQYGWLRATLKGEGVDCTNIVIPIEEKVHKQ